MDLCGRLGANVRRYRKEAGQSQEALADAAGVARSYMSDVERGARNPTLKIVERIALSLQIEPHLLLL